MPPKTRRANLLVGGTLFGVVAGIYYLVMYRIKSSDELAEVERQIEVNSKTGEMTTREVKKPRL